MPKQTHTIKKTPPSKGLSLLTLFNYLGASLIFFGIAFFININWATLSNSSKIFSTLGAAILAYIIGITLSLNKKYLTTSSAFFMIAGLVLPIGLYITLTIYNLTANMEKVDVLISAICLTVFSLSHLFSRRTIFLLFIILFTSYFFISLTDLSNARLHFISHDLIEYKLIILGLCYLFLGRYLDNEKKYPLTGPLYFFGCLFILSASYSLGGFYFSHPVFSRWKIITAILIICTFILSVPLKSKSFLYLGALFLILYLADMSSRFAAIFGHVGWPLILIIAGVLFMLLGYIVVNIHKRIMHK